MAYEYDRFEREDSGGSFLMGLLAGTVLGAGLGMLFAPKSGSELRNQLSEQTGRLRNTASDAYNQASEKVSHMVDRGREAYDRARSAGWTGSTPGSSTGTTPPSGSGLGDTGTTGPTGVGSTYGGGGYNTGTTGYGTDNRG
jgi:hypothetical protein